MMTSSVAAFTTSLLPTNATKAPDIDDTCSYAKENSPTAGPITEILAAQTAGASVHRQTANNVSAVNNSAKPKTISNTNSKIPHPHPHPHPLAVLLATKTNQFRRSASVRMRGSKSNLLFTALNRDNNNKVHNNPFKSVVTKKMEHLTTRNSNVLATKNETANDQLAFNHELSSTTGRVSPRRKLVLNSQLNADAALTLSLSLRSGRRKSVDFENQSLKTNSSTESCQSKETLKDVQLQDNTLEVTKTQQEIKSSKQQSEFEEEAEAAANLSGSSTPKAQCEHQIAKYDDNVQGLQKQDINKMSLNLNGPTASTATTTNVVRPTTLATASTTSSTATATTTTTSSRSVSKSTLASPKTPKTPTSAKAFPHSNNFHSNHCHNHQHCSKYQQPQILPTVPETKLTPRTPPVTPDSPNTYLEDDLDSLYSFATTTSGRSTMSCEHPYVARNGTTFSGRKMKYVVHCSNYAGQVGADYLTPTQRAQRQIRRLKELLCVARQELEQKDSEILRLTREVVELRLFKASLSSPEDRSASSDAVTVREAELKTSQDVSPIVDMVDDASKSSPRHIPHCSHHHQHGLNLSSEMQSSFADSGHFEDMTSSSVHSKDSYAGHTHDIACGRDGPTGAGGEGVDDDNDDEVCKAESYEMQRQELIRMYEQRIEDLIRTQDSATSEIKRSHNDKVEALLQKLAECNTRYADIVPDYEHAKERIRELEKQLEDLQRKLIEHEEKQNKMYLHMYQQGQEAERIARADQALELAHRAPTNKVSINELLHQLQSTQDELENIREAECRKETGGNHALLTAKEAISLWVLGARKTIYRRLLDAQKNRTHVDPEVTLQFLKSAVYYFLTDKENSQGHLQAIESILEFTEAEKQNITKARSPK